MHVSMFSAVVTEKSYFLAVIDMAQQSGDNDIVGAIALYLEVPDTVRFAMTHTTGSLIIGLRRLDLL